MKTIITYGTFDIFHVGHVRLLKRLKELGDRLIVAVSTDDFNRQKGKSSLINFDDRCEVLSSVKYIDLIISESSWDQKRRDIEYYNVDIFAIGDDWLNKFDDLKDLCEVIYLPRTFGISSTSIKTSAYPMVPSRLIELRNSAESILQIVNSFGLNPE